MKSIQCLAPFVALIAVMCCSTLAFASSGTALTPDPSAYCIQNTPFQPQQQESGWQVVFQSVVGDSFQNDWGCQYLVQTTIPTALDPTGTSFTLPPFLHTVPMDWNGMCNQQYPGAHAEWIPGPETGVDGAPWGCMGAPGVIYDPAEQSDGTHQVVSGG